MSRSLLRKEASPGSALLHDVVWKSFLAYKTHQHWSRKNNKKITISCDNVRDQNRVLPLVRSLARSIAAATSSSTDTTSNIRVPNSQKGGLKKKKAKDPTTNIKEEEHSSNSSSIGGFTFQGKWVWGENGGSASSYPVKVGEEQEEVRTKVMCTDSWSAPKTQRGKKKKKKKKHRKTTTTTTRITTRTITAKSTTDPSFLPSFSGKRGGKERPW